MSIALNLARNDICVEHRSNQTSFWCDDLINFERKSFYSYLSDLEDKMSMPLMTLSSINTDGNYDDLLVYNGNEFKFLLPIDDYVLDSTNCLTGNLNDDCKSCLKFRQSRTETIEKNEKISSIESMIQTSSSSPTSSEQILPSSSSPTIDHLMDDHGVDPDSSHSNLVENGEERSKQSSSSSSSSIHVETYEITLGLLLPLHKSGQSILDCSDELNLPAFYIYEASKWIVEKINQNNYLIPGIEIKLELIDTCSSPFYATQELAHLTTSDSKVQPIAFVASLPRDHYKQVGFYSIGINFQNL